MPRPTADLSSAQLEAVAHPGGPLVVRGGAGTGKTRTLLERFARLLRDGAPSDSVLLLAFSAAAAADAREWVETRIEGSTVRVKVGRRNGRVTNIAPEYEDAAAAATATGLPLKKVYALAAERATQALSPPH